ALSSSYVSDFPNQGRLQRVMVQADEDARMQPADILNLTVPNKSGVAVPLSTIATVSWENGTEQSVRFNGYPSMKLSASPATGVSTGQAMAAVQKMVDELGGGYSFEWGGQSREEAKGGAQTLIAYGLAVAAVFLVLAALYESWSIPLAVILVIPLGLIGAAAGVTGRNLFEGLLGSVPSFANDIYFQVGFVTVMGLSAKNAILIIEFAKDLQAQGKSAVEAALEAARLRFRPIIMTSFA
ncbi:efflux RND transporter permease subunit, partial [Enterobacter hormaechei subsp. steigerwaltii]|nr:efflux RND transporter permease subunit [Enterobacter hormaechei subsp. steigerwaltii]